MNYFAARTAPTWSQPNPQSTRKPTGRIEIRLSTQPPRYSQGDGPPPIAPLSMVLKNDSTAQVLDKRVMQGPPKNGELSLQLYYIVGWTDLPAARVAIQAQFIYDYVPPRVLEDFEYQLYLDREAREEAEEEASALEAVRQMVEAESGIRTGKGKAVFKRRPGRRRKRQRPSKADLIAKEQAAATSFDQTEAAHASVVTNENTSGLSLGGAPSLSTPKKKPVPLTFVIANSEDDIVITDGNETDADDDTSVQRQVRGETEETHKTSGSDDIKPISSNLHALPEVMPELLYAATQPRKLQPVQHSSFPAKSTLQHYGFTPAARSKASWPALSQTSYTSEVSMPIKAEFQRTPEKATLIKAEKKSKKPKPLPVEPEEEEAAVYEVKGLEGMRYEEVDGRIVRVFKVRWKGNWPPEDNPTWEPEENITPKLVKKYLTKQEQAGHKPTPLVLTTKPHLKRKWSSVAEAFMGDEEDGQATSSSSVRKSSSGSGGAIEMGNQQGVVEPEEDGGLEDDLLQVTEQDSAQIVTPFKSKEFNDVLRKELETSFRRQSIKRSSFDQSS